MKLLVAFMIIAAVVTLVGYLLNRPKKTTARYKLIWGPECITSYVGVHLESEHGSALGSHWTAKSAKEEDAELYFRMNGLLPQKSEVIHDYSLLELKDLYDIERQRKA